MLLMLFVGLLCEALELLVDVLFVGSKDVSEPNGARRAGIRR